MNISTMYVSQPPTTHKSNCYTSALKGHGMTTPCRSTERPLVVPNSCLRPKLSSHSLLAITRSILEGSDCVVLKVVLGAIQVETMPEPDKEELEAETEEG